MNFPLVETFIAPSHRHSVRIVLENALRETESSNYELEFQTKSGEIRHLLVNTTTRRDSESNIAGVVGVAQDVTEEKKHDRGVAAMATGLRQLIDTANAPILELVRVAILKSQRVVDGISVLLLMTACLTFFFRHFYLL
jgi:hypothetical protein